YVAANQQRLGLSEADIATLRVSHDYTDISTGIQHIYASQRINGLEVVNTHFSLHTNAAKSFSSNQLISTSAFRMKPVSVSISSSDAVQKLMDVVKYNGERKVEVKTPEQGLDKVTVYKRAGSSIWDIPARLVYYKMDKVK